MDRLTPKDHGERIAIFRAEIVGALARRELARGELAAALRQLSTQRFRPPGADATRTYAVPTLQRWHYALRHGGLAALAPKPRRDRGRGRTLTPAQRDLLLQIRHEHPGASVPLILRTLVADGRLAPRAVSAPTVRRLYRANGLDRRARQGGPGQRMRLRWEAERPGALWHGDVCHARAILLDGTSHPVRIHALLDDASRYVVALEAHHTEREIDMLGLFVRALRREGPPDALYLDNGATYRGEILQTACARLSISLLHARPYDAPARGKMERFYAQLEIMRSSRPRGALGARHRPRVLRIVLRVMIAARPRAGEGGHHHVGAGWLRPGGRSATSAGAARSGSRRFRQRHADARSR